MSDRTKKLCFAIIMWCSCALSSGCDCEADVRRDENTTRPSSSLETEGEPEPVAHPSDQNALDPDEEPEPEGASLEAECFAGSQRACDQLGH